LFAPRVRVEEDRVVLGGCVWSERLGEALRRAVARSMPNRQVVAEFEHPLAPPEFVRLPEGEPLLVSPAPGAERVSSARRSPGERSSGVEIGGEEAGGVDGAFALLLRGRGVCLKGSLTAPAESVSRGEDEPASAGDYALV